VYTDLIITFVYGIKITDMVKVRLFYIYLFGFFVDSCSLVEIRKGKFPIVNLNFLLARASIPFLATAHPMLVCNFL
jgi:hypothetical protein